MRRQRNTRLRLSLPVLPEVTAVVIWAFLIGCWLGMMTYMVVLLAERLT